MTKPNGKYIVLDGPDGTGKGTQIERLQAKLKSLGREVLVVREPGGTPIGEEIRNLLKSKEFPRTAETEIFLFSAARAELMREVIEPALQKGTCVISDRSFISTIAYQVYGHQRMDLLPMVADLIKYAVGDRKMDKLIILIILNIDPEVALERAKGRNAGAGDRFDDMEQGFHERVRQGYLQGAKDYPHEVVDAAGTVEEVEERIWQKIALIFA